MLAVLSVITAVTLLTPLIKTSLFLRFGMDTINLTICSLLIFDHPSDINATTFDSDATAFDYESQMLLH